MTRLDYLKDRYSFNKILDSYECKEFSDYGLLDRNKKIRGSLIATPFSYFSVALKPIVSFP